MKITVGRLIALPIVVVLTSLVVVTVVVQSIGSQINEQTLAVQEKAVPKALLALSMLEELGDMNSNVLEYVVGEADEVEAFEENYGEFNGFLTEYQAIVGEDDEAAKELAQFAATYYHSAKDRVFKAYNPIVEENALNEANRLTRDIGSPMEKILDDLKELEVADAGSSGDFNEVVNDDLPGVQYYLELVDEAGDMISSLNAYMRGENDTAAAFEKDAKTFDKYFALLRPLETRDSEVEKLDIVAKYYEELLKGGRSIFDSFDPIAKKAAVAAIDEMEHAIFSRLEERLDMLAAKAKMEEESDLTELRASVTLLEISAWVLLAVSLIIGCGFLFGINRALTRPLFALTEAMNSLSSGNLDVEIGSIARKDEVGEMANAVQVFKDNAINMQRLQNEQEGAKKRAEEEKREAMHQLAGEFEAKVGHVVEGVSKSAGQLQTTAETMSLVSKETSDQSSTVGSASDQAAENVENVASAAKELGGSIGEISRQMQKQVDMAEHTASVAEDSNQQVQDLAQRANSIDEVVNMITGIAEKTNLLALNATIEAARAGEAGSGFAVVAGEVKSLANQTARATDQIAGQIKAIQDQTSSAVSAIQTIKDKIDAMKEVSVSVASAIEEQNSATHEIGRNAEEMTVRARQVSGAISNVTEAAQKTGTSAGDVLSSARELAQQGDVLTEEVNAFIAQVRAA